MPRLRDRRIAASLRRILAGVIWSAEATASASYSVASALERANTKAEAIASALHTAPHSVSFSASLRSDGSGGALSANDSRMSVVVM
jgi:hypothetical protein